VEITPEGPHEMVFSEIKIFTATFYDNSDIIPPEEVTFEWYLEPATLGMLNTTTGDRVMFTAGTTEILGTIYVNATWAGITTSDAVVINVVSDTGTVKGTVKDAFSGNPIEGVTVEVVATGLSAVTNESGEYTITDVPAGVQGIKASKTGYSDVIKTVNISRQTIVTVDFELVPEPLKKLIIDAPSEVFCGDEFTVIIKDEDGNLIEGASVTFACETKTTDMNGKVVFTAPYVTNDTVYEIHASKDGYENATPRTIIVKKIAVSAGVVLFNIALCIAFVSIRSIFRRYEKE
jgi:hypothetical protein